MLSHGVETWSKSLLKVGFARKASVPLGLQYQTPQSLASGPDAMGLGVWPRARCRVSGVWPRGLRKTPFAPTYSPVGLTPWPNHIIQFMNLYLRTIPELLGMSVISSGTPNNIRSPNHITHIRIYRQQMLSVRTLRVRELCRHDRDTSPVNNQ